MKTNNKDPVKEILEDKHFIEQISLILTKCSKDDLVNDDAFLRIKKDLMAPKYFTYDVSNYGESDYYFGDGKPFEFLSMVRKGSKRKTYKTYRVYSDDVDKTWNHPITNTVNLLNDPLDFYWLHKFVYYETVMYINHLKSSGNISAFYSAPEKIEEPYMVANFAPKHQKYIEFEIKDVIKYAKSENMYYGNVFYVTQKEFKKILSNFLSLFSFTDSKVIVIRKKINPVVLAIQIVLSSFVKSSTMKKENEFRVVNFYPLHPGLNKMKSVPVTRSGLSVSHKKSDVNMYYEYAKKIL